MFSYGALAILAVLVGANAQTQSCSKQMEMEHRCMFTIETSPEVQMVKDRMKNAFKTCAPNFPTDCHAEWDAAHECGVSIAKTMDTDQVFVESRSKSQPAIDQCFADSTPNIKEGIAEIMMKPGHKMHKKKWHHKRHHNATASGSGESGESGEKHSSESSASAETSAESGSASNETSSSGSYERHGKGGHGGHGKHGKGGHGKHHKCRPHRHHKRHHGGHHGENNATSSSGSASSSSESGENSTSGSHSGGRSGGKSGSGEKHGMRKMRPECRKTKEQMKCVKEEMKKMGKDSAFVDVINTLVHQKQKCKSLVQWSCTAKCPKTKKCIFKAGKPCREAFMQKMKTCLQEKGFTLPPHMEHHHQNSFTTPLPVLEH